MEGGRGGEYIMMYWVCLVGQLGPFSIERAQRGPSLRRQLNPKATFNRF